MNHSKMQIWTGILQYHLVIFFKVEHLPWKTNKGVSQPVGGLLPQTSKPTAKQKLSERNHKIKMYIIDSDLGVHSYKFTWSVAVPRSINVRRKTTAPAIPYESTRFYYHIMNIISMPSVMKQGSCKRISDHFLK